MLKLIHHPLSAPSRKIRLQLAEKDLEFELELEKPWERREAFLLLNPAGEVPVLLAEDGTPITDFNGDFRAVGGGASRAAIAGVDAA